VREVERISQSHQKPTTEMISLLNLTISGPTRHNPSSTRVSPQTNDFQKPIKFVSNSGKVLFQKESEKASEEKSGEKPREEKPVEKPSGEKPSEQPQPKPKPKLVRFHCAYCGRDGHKDEFCFKRRREERMAKE
jgi:hypothetical protein